MTETLYDGKTTLEILQNMTFSYSSVSSFNQCPLSFKMMYLDKRKRDENFFAQLGTLSHEIMELYLSGKLEKWELDKYFIDKYQKVVTLSPPLELAKFNYEEGMIDKLTKFFINTDFDRDDYDVISLEEKFEFVLNGFKLVVKPDAILRRRSDNLLCLFDYKTSGYKTDSHKGYGYQCSLYSKIFELKMGEKIDEASIIYLKETSKPRNKPMQYGKVMKLDLDENVLEKFEVDVRNIFSETNWDAKPDMFFCKNICSLRSVCSVKEEKFGF